MLGYIRPYPDELTVKELRRYRAVYCGICKRLGARHGVFERLAVSYDTSFLALLFLALSDDEPEEEAQRCILHPVSKRLIAQKSAILDYSAGLTTFLAFQKGLDDQADANPVRGRVVAACFRSGARRFAEEHPQLSQDLEAILADSYAKERAAMKAAKCSDNSDADRIEQAKKLATDLAACSGKALARIFKEAASLMPEDTLSDLRHLHIIEALGQALGEWVYLIDAYADWEEDIKNDSFNPYAAIAEKDYQKLATELLQEKVVEINALAALLPYRKDAPIIENILYFGLRQAEDRIKNNQHLEALQQGAFL
ncbi:MAG: DUF5685 family protein [Eubacteriales bacterium]|nr:DUF5685 family protein [Eubacteriales bacterium]